MQKSWADILGRTRKTQTFDWDGDPYLTTEIKFNGRDQSVEVEQTDEEATVTQTSTATFDGHGRLASSHRPEQRENSNNLKYTTYSYNPDDSIITMTDGRGVIANYTYNSRGLVTDIAWNVGSTGVTDVDDVEFEYDNLGNRTSMTDGLGVVNYAYDPLSRMTNETRIFSDTLSDKPSGDYDLDYTYHIGGQLKSISDPWESQINYGMDKAGRLTSVVGSATFGGVTTYAQDSQYRAWGGLKHLEYGNAVETDITYNDRLQPETFNLQKSGNAAAMTKTYEYHKDGSLKFVDDGLNSIFDRLHLYDHQGRVKVGKSSTEASGTTVTSNLDTNLPYRQSYFYNAFDNMTGRDNLHWGVEQNIGYAYENNRMAGWTYDADGRATTARDVSIFQTYQEFDASGRMIRSYGDAVFGATDIEPEYSGDGREEKRKKKVVNSDMGNWLTLDPTYYIRSSVLGGAVVSEVDATGKKKLTNVYAAGTKIAVQSISIVSSVPVEAVAFEHSDPGGASQRTTLSNGFVANLSVEFDPSGANTGTATPYTEPDPEPEDLEPAYHMLTDAPLMVNGMVVPCYRDGIRYAGGDCQVLVSGLGHSVQPSPFSDPWTLSSLGIIGYWENWGSDGVGPNGENLTAVTNTRWVVLGPDPFAKFRAAEKLSDGDCDKKLSEVFGGAARAMEDLGDLGINPEVPVGPMRSRSPHSARARNDLPAMVEHSTFTDMPDGSVRETKRMKRNSERGGIIHTYTNPPNGPVGSKSTASSLTTPSGWLSTATYFTGGNSGLVFNYAGGISIEFVHVGTTNTNNEPSVPGKRPAGQLVRIGYIGGAGGGSDINRWHSHIVFFSNKARNERIDPRSIFCGF